MKKFFKELFCSHLYVEVYPKILLSEDIKSFGDSYWGGTSKIQTYAVMKQCICCHKPKWAKIEKSTIIEKW